MKDETTTKHIPVLKKEVMELIKQRPGGVLVDATLGGAGHFTAIVEEFLKGDRSSENGDQGKQSLKTTFIGIDQDEKATNRFANYLEKTGNWQQENKEKDECTRRFLHKEQNVEINLINENFENLDSILKNLGVRKTDFVLADLGTSQDQLEEEGRGFSFLRDEPLDMRMDKKLQVTAADLINGLSKKELIELFNKLADLQSVSFKLVKQIVEHRKYEPILTTKQLVELIRQAVHGHTARFKSVGSLASEGSSKTYLSKTPKYGDKLEARVFQTLRIAVNHELGSLRRFLPKAFETLNANGKLVIISFHSGEDRIVKDYFRDKVNKQKAEQLEKLLLPSAVEIQENKRSSSARLRAIQKI
ncbi:MAG: Ribosomal RNA small subunit methyltransferase H 1 [candidate division WS6 bacterium GW2011_GWA2_37_6]|uniref:Ribosomal RNA small subunit methyltransferase H n=1 Tax=candidate division WS6 bacterium GW2011_GWA2_37_6 TaxID=1619087 RepID=A0A0G0GU37_9BACT|nr:MAG: Ribosomal RNA small subunit methyltransferase H 1 [candidate division WS6 bacterium GW2011_GWA2_37_6]